MYGNGAMTGMAITPMLTKPTHTVLRQATTVSFAVVLGAAMLTSVPFLIGVKTFPTTGMTTFAFGWCVRSSSEK